MNKDFEVWIMIKKELSKFLGNKRVIFSTIILPGLVIGVLYSAMAQFIERREEKTNVYNSAIWVIDMPEDIQSLFDDAGIICKVADVSYKNEIKDDIKNKDEVLLICFPNNFVITGDVSFQNCPNVEIYYNASFTESYNYFTRTSTLLNTYESSIANVFDVNAGDETYNLSSEKDSMGKNIAMILPMLLMGLMFSACMSIAAESIAGEKEQGTIATLLATPVKSYNIALAKVISLSIIALCSATSSYIGVIFSLPQLLNMAGEAMLKAYEIKHYILLFLTLISVILIMIAVMSIVSAGAKTIKEASTSLSPFAAGAMLLGMTCMIQDEVITEYWVYFIPFYNSVQEIYSILNFEINMVNFSIMFISNLFYMSMCIWILAKMFKSEKIMFS